MVEKVEHRTYSLCDWATGPSSMEVSADRLPKSQIFYQTKKHFQVVEKTGFKMLWSECYI